MRPLRLWYPALGLPGAAVACYPRSFPPTGRTSVVTANSTAERPIPEPPARRENIPLAIFLMVSAGAIFSFSSAASKWLVETYPVGEVLFSRVFVSLIFFSAFALPTYGLAVLRTGRPTAHVLRSMSQFTSQTLLLIAFSIMPL